MRSDKEAMKVIISDTKKEKKDTWVLSSSDKEIDKGRLSSKFEW